MPRTNMQHTLGWKSGLDPCYIISSVFILSPAPSLALSQNRCRLAAHITEPLQTAIKTDVQHRLCMKRERVMRKKKETGGDMSQNERSKERKYEREKMFSTTSPSKSRTDTVSIDLYYNSSKL